MKTILVTGGAGYIGSFTTLELLQADYEVVIVDNLVNSDVDQIDRLERLANKRPKFYEADITNRPALDKVFKDHDISAVMHFAALKAVGESTKKPLAYYQNNVGGLLTLLQAMRKHGCKNLVFSSSATAYGNSLDLPYTEIAADKPAANPYGATKQISERIIRDCVTAGLLESAVALRYFNPIGAHSSGCLGELPRGAPNNIVPYLIQTVAGWRDSLTVFGDDYPTADGSCERDYIHITDLAKAHLRVLQAILENKSLDGYEVFNIGTGKPTSVLQLISKFEKATGQKVTYKIGPRRAGDLAKFYASPEKIKQILGWQAELSIDQALTDAWSWQQNLTKP